MPPVKEKKFLILTRCNLFRWIKGRAFPTAISQHVAKFIWEECIYKHEIFSKLIIDGRPKNKHLIKTFTKKYDIKRVVISAYNSKANKIIKRSHKPIKATLAKIINEGKED